MRILEVLPFSATRGGAAIAAFGLALIFDDGVLAFVAFAFTAGVVGLILRQIV